MPEEDVVVTATYKDIVVNDPGTGEEEPGTGEVQGEEPPAGKSTITFDLNGGTLDGETSFTVEAEVGSEQNNLVTTDSNTNQNNSVKTPSTKDTMKPIVLIILMILSVVAITKVIKLKENNKQAYWK